MKITLITINQKYDDWVLNGFKEYQKRLPKTFELLLKEISLKKRSKNSGLSKVIEEESKLILKAIPPLNKVIALDSKGLSFSSEELAKNFNDFYNQNQDITILIGGPEGLSTKCLASSDHKWSLSKLTFPHNIVKIIIAEAIYRSWSIINNHPYHK